MSEREFDYNLHYRSLPNDVRHLEVSIPSAKTAACVALVKTGSRNAGALAHWDEHMRFMGTRNYPNYKLWAKASDQIGAEHNAETEREYVQYHIFSPAEHTRKSLILLGELFTPTFPSREMKKGKELVFSEIKEDSDDQAEVALEFFEKFLYDGSTMANSVYGDLDSVKSYTRRDLRKYSDRWYRGANVLVVTAGKIGRIRGLVDECFGGIPSGSIQPYEGQPAYGKPGLEVHTTPNTGEVYFMLGVPGVPRNDERYYALKVAATIIGGSNTIGTSRLYQAQINKGNSYNLTTEMEARSDTGYVAARGLTSPKDLDSVLSRIRKEMYGLASSTTREEVKRAKTFLRGQLKRDLENTLKVAEVVGIPALMFDKAEHPRDLIKKFNAVRLDDVRRVSEELLNQEEERLVVVGPVNEHLRRIRKFNPH